MDAYLLLKYAHVVSATLLFGTGLGTAFHGWMAHRSGNRAAIAVAGRNVVLADRMFVVRAAARPAVCDGRGLRRMGRRRASTHRGRAMREDSEVYVGLGDKALVDEDLANGGEAFGLLLNRQCADELLAGEFAEFGKHSAEGEAL